MSLSYRLSVYGCKITPNTAIIKEKTAKRRVLKISDTVRQALPKTK